MKRNLIFILLVGLFLSCQKEEFVATSTQSNSDLQVAKNQIDLAQENLDPSILTSEWWSKMNPATRNLISMELSQSDKPVTLSEIQRRQKDAWNISAGKTKICPGYPVANPEGDVTLASQADVVAFGALKCKEIIGSLSINDVFNPDPVCDLQPLKGLKEIGSSMSINSNCLTSLAGLEKLKSVGKLGPFGFIGINGDNIVDIEALSKLSTVTGSINIIDCDQLTSITSAFSKITTIGSGQTSAPITSVYVLNFNDNALLTDISGFSNLTNIEGGLRVLSSGSLQDLDDLSGLNNIGDDIFIVDNTSLLNVNELSNISSISDDLLVFDNPALTECCGLYSLLCSDAPTCSTSGVAGNIAIFNNGAGCTDIDIIANGPCN